MFSVIAISEDFYKYRRRFDISQIFQELLGDLHSVRNPYISIERTEIDDSYVLDEFVVSSETSRFR